MEQSQRQPGQKNLYPSLFCSLPEPISLEKIMCVRQLMKMPQVLQLQDNKFTNNNNVKFIVKS